MRRRFLKLFIGLLALAPLTGTLAAGSDQSPVLSGIADSGTLRVGMSAGQPPFNFANRDGKIDDNDLNLFVVA